MIKSNLEDRRQAVDALVAEASKLAESNPEVAIERANAAKSLAGDLCLSEDEYATEVATCEIVLARAAYAMSQFDVSLQAAVRPKPSPSKPTTHPF